ncbi:hypothetical protein L3Y34_002949 [Caenorhabditis briggsae]|uniref:Receptor L-domain domain-containing protein n=1 Tax=Caenorhabditis briggsae TaxID=6238 RepID=A0AAE9A7K7_CAEBR|nr:hypothetical protein L3Y34_002949 [Caenorhabditis briggsae]
MDDEFGGCDKKCTFPFDVLSSKNILAVSKCPKLCSVLLISDETDLTVQQLKNGLKNLKTLIGGIYVFSTSFKDLSFLDGLKTLKSKYNGIDISMNENVVELGFKNLTSFTGGSYNVYGNDKLLRLGFPKLKNFTCATKDCYTNVMFSNFMEPKFCVTTQEMKIFMVNKKTTISSYGKVCDLPKNSSNKKMCSVPTVGCEELIGNLTIGAKFDVKKVKSLKILYGSLIMKGTNFTNFNFLPNLTHIAQLDSMLPAIDVQNNKQLKTAKFPKLKRIVCGDYNCAVFKNNNAALLKDLDSCWAIRSAITQDRFFISSSSPLFNNKMCEDLEQKKTTKKTGTTKKSAKKA